MKQIIIGGPRSGKTYKNVLSAILEHKGKIIFLSTKNEISYLNIEKMFIRKDILKDNIMDYCLNENKNIFIQCKTRQECNFIGRILSETSVLDNENILLIIDEGLYILGNIPWDIIGDISDKESNILITFLSDKYLKEREDYIKKLNDNNESNTNKRMEKWDIINVKNILDR